MLKLNEFLFNYYSGMIYAYVVLILIFIMESNMIKHKKYFKMAALSAVLFCSTGANAASLQNGDFSSGFNSWGGATLEEDPDDAFNSILTNVTPSTAPNFSITSDDKAKLTTTYDTNGIFAVDLFQEFTVQSLSSPLNTLTLGFDYTAVLDDVDDEWLVQLGTMAYYYTDADSLSGNILFDITSYAGQNVDLLFSLSNNAGGDDSLTIDNIEITQSQSASPVPEPASIFLLGAGLFAMRRKFS